MEKDTLLNREIDLVLLSLEMTKQAYHVKRCWSIIKQIQQERKDYPNEINISLGFYRTVFASLVTSVLPLIQQKHDRRLSSDHFEVFVDGWSAKAAYPCKLRYVHLASSICRIVLIKQRRYILLGQFGSPHFCPACFGIRHS